MKHRRSLTALVALVLGLGLLAALGGLWPGPGRSFPGSSARGEELLLNGRGLYYWDTRNAADQMKGNDLVTLAVGLPLLALSFFLARRGSMRGRLLLAGTLGYFLYTYASMCFGAAFNPFFLVYVALFGSSLWAFVLAILEIDVAALHAGLSPRLPRRWIAGLLYFTAAFLALAWLGRVGAALRPGAVPALENATSMFIQAMDLGLVLPLCLVSATLLLRRRPWGSLLAAISLLKFTTLGLAVSSMGIWMALDGQPVSAVELAVFPTITAAALVLALLLLRSVGRASESAVQVRS